MQKLRQFLKKLFIESEKKQIELENDCFSDQNDSINRAIDNATD